MTAITLPPKIETPLAEEAQRQGTSAWEATLTNRRIILSARFFSLGLSIITLCFSFWGCQKPDVPSRPMDNARMQQIAQEWQRQGVLSQQDYGRAVGILDKTRKTGRMSDADLDWLLALLRQPTRDPSAVHLLVMIEFVNLGSVTEAQSVKIRSAIEPLQESSVPAESQLASLVIKNMRDNTQHSAQTWLIALLAAVGFGGGMVWYVRQKKQNG